MQPALSTEAASVAASLLFGGLLAALTITGEGFPLQVRSAGPLSWAPRAEALLRRQGWHVQRRGRLGACYLHITGRARPLAAALAPGEPLTSHHARHD